MCDFHLNHCGNNDQHYIYFSLVDESMRGPLHESRMKDLRDYFSAADFTENPENSPYFELRQQQHLGNVEWVSEYSVLIILV